MDVTPAERPRHTTIAGRYGHTAATECGRARGHDLPFRSYLRIEPSHRVIEVGNILYTPRLQRTRGATEAMFLMARHAFEDLRYRRYEWHRDTAWYAMLDGEWLDRKAAFEQWLSP